LCFIQSTSDQAQITAEWIAAALKQISDELCQLTASLDARNKAVDSARVSVLSQSFAVVDLAV